ncbi:hypothetical protein [Paenisporosarcina antarctica]|uniref:DUF4367 domain-containing protein n=1 Tax=Paenisporosarcina antarctica TaxID=417367 RepID=A0A4P7A2X2_9BACL|nr:hypothetical protein [Paenisporosarcina antarctica]QBP42306.1 hypothetical protein E2636_14600 [Paenisporosarcina antarctica]
MKKYIIISGLLLLVGCSNGLDTSQLSESQQGEDGLIKFYSAPSVEVAIDALPYEVNLPEQLPFETEGFKTLGITDFGGKGKNPEAQFMAIDEKENNLILSTTTAHREYPDSDPGEITLDNGYQAFYMVPNGLDIIVKHITYSYTLIMPQLEEKQIKEELMKLAEQISD